jgi:hypothetical protein
MYKILDLRTGANEDRTCTSVFILDLRTGANEDTFLAFIFIMIRVPVHAGTCSIYRQTEIYVHVIHVPGIYQR